MSKLSQYGGRILTIDGQRIVEMLDPNDNSKSRHQYRAIVGVLEHRLLDSDGTVIEEWAPRTPAELRQMQAVRGQYHPILDEVGL